MDTKAKKVYIFFEKKKHTEIMRVLWIWTSKI